MKKFKEYYYTTNSGIYLSLKEALKSIKKGEFIYCGKLTKKGKKGIVNINK